MRYNYIAIEGNIGAGKTTLSNLLAKHYEARLLLEGFEENVFLARFYKNPEKYAFSLELSFLAERYQQLKEASSAIDMFSNLLIADYYLSKSLIFARANLKDDEYQLFARLYHIMFASLPKPELLVYLYVSYEKLQANIVKRGREYEQGISLDYLQKLQTNYFEFLKQQKDLKILILDTTDLDFLNKKNDFCKVLEVIDKPYQIGINRIVI